jgi:uncharacterized membrane protein required for colicin V production
MAVLSKTRLPRFARNDNITQLHAAGVIARSICDEAIPASALTFFLTRGMASMQIPFDQSMIADFLLLCVAGYLVLSSVRKGCVPTFYSLLALCLSYPAACFLFPLFASFFRPPVTARLLGDAVAFAAFAAALYFVLLLVFWAVLSLLKRAAPDAADQIAAGMLGLLKTAAMMVFIILIAVTFLPNRSGYIKHSFLARSLLSVVNTIAQPLPTALKEKFLQKRDGIVSEKREPALKK